MMEMVASSRVDVSQSPYDLTTFWGRMKHYAWVTDPRLTIVSSKELQASKELLEKYK